MNTVPQPYYQHWDRSDPRPAIRPHQLFNIVQISPGHLEARVHPNFALFIQSILDNFCGKIDDAMAHKMIELRLNQEIKNLLTGW